MHDQLHSEQELLKELATGERIATEQIYSKHYPIITKWIRNNGGTESDAADVYQEAMVILYEKAQTEDFRLTCKIGTYLFSISKNLWYKKINKSQKQPDSLSEPGFEEKLDRAYEDDINVHHERENHFRQLDDALEQLGEPCSSLLKAFYQQDKSMTEIALQFGYTNPDNAKTQKYKCLTRLKKLFYGVQAK